MSETNLSHVTLFGALFAAAILCVCGCRKGKRRSDAREPLPTSAKCCAILQHDSSACVPGWSLIREAKSSATLLAGLYARTSRWRPLGCWWLALQRIQTFTFSRTESGRHCLASKSASAQSNGQMASWSLSIANKTFSGFHWLTMHAKWTDALLSPVPSAHYLTKEDRGFLQMKFSLSMCLVLIPYY